MSEYACQKCASTGFVGEMRRVVVIIGAGNEMQAAGIVPVRRCANVKCNTLTTVSNIQFGDVMNLQPIPPKLETVAPAALPPLEDAAAVKAKAKAHLEHMRAELAKAEAALQPVPTGVVEGKGAPRGAPPLEAVPNPDVDAAPAQPAHPGDVEPPAS